MAYWPRLKTKVLVTVMPRPSVQVNGTRNSSAPGASTKLVCSDFHAAKWVGAASPAAPMSPLCNTYRVGGGS